MDMSPCVSELQCDLKKDGMQKAKTRGGDRVKVVLFVLQLRAASKKRLPLLSLDNLLRWTLFSFQIEWSCLCIELLLLL